MLMSIFLLVEKVENLHTFPKTFFSSFPCLFLHLMGTSYDFFLSLQGKESVKKV